MSISRVTKFPTQGVQVSLVMAHLRGRMSKGCLCCYDVICHDVWCWWEWKKGPSRCQCRLGVWRGRLLREEVGRFAGGGMFRMVEACRRDEIEQMV
jgi:hypothetical protein